MNTLPTLALLGPLLACGASSQTPNHAVASHVAAPGVAFESYRTFAFGPAEPPRAGYEVTPRSLEVQRRLGVLVKAALESRGLTQTAEQPDLVVKLATGSGSGYQLRPSAEDSVLIPPDRAPGPVPALGFIGINIYAGGSGSQLWQGSAFAEVDPMAIDDALLRRGVDHMLQGFATPPAESMAQAP
jgi:hypothetical protein